MARQRRKVTLSKSKARDFFLKKQLLAGIRLSKGKTGTLRIIEHLGYVQIDTINVVERSHHLVLYTRQPGYKHVFLHDLQAKDRSIFEYWAHAASFVPMKDYRYYLPAIKRKPKPGSWFDQWTKKHPRLIKQVKKRIEKEGPLTPSDFADDQDRRRGPWWDWKPAKAALEVLFWRGDLMITERRNFQRVYDLTEKVLPDNIDTTMPTEQEGKQFFVRRALNALGFATIGDINRYIGISGKLNEPLNNMVKKGDVTEVELTGLKQPHYVLNRDMIQIMHSKRQIDDLVRLLSPFDNSIILRDRTEAIFDFKYSLECYVPKPKRKYGYFSLPILWRNKLVGRVDPKADRERGVLLIQNLHIEKDVDNQKAFLHALANAVNDFARFNRCEHIEIKAKIPTAIKRRLSSRLL
ncbi:MAG: YcaQ family DNA glycosylase [candidate division WOR-3 bacterium]|nr:MAG: YcaQ family DNA glycosylase [candidate division WOR-3 bacterium]